MRESEIQSFSRESISTRTFELERNLRDNAYVYAPVLTHRYTRHLRHFQIANDKWRISIREARNKYEQMARICVYAKV